MFEVDLAATLSANNSRTVAEAARINPGLTVAMVATCRAPERARTASALALEAFEKAFAWHGGPGAALETEARMFAAAHHAYELLIERRRDAELATTALTALSFAPRHAIVASIRDCCAFRIHAGAVEPISSATSTSASSLAVPPVSVDIDTFTIPAEPGDVFVVCTSRTWDLLSPANLLREAAAAESASDVCERLRGVLAGGGIEDAALAVAMLVPQTMRASKPDIVLRRHHDSTPPPDAGASSSVEPRENSC
jgi:hypothetical protein